MAAMEVSPVQVGWVAQALLAARQIGGAVQSEVKGVKAAMVAPVEAVVAAQAALHSLCWATTLLWVRCL